MVKQLKDKLKKKKRKLKRKKARRKAALQFAKAKRMLKQPLTQGTEQKQGKQQEKEKKQHRSPNMLFNPISHEARRTLLRYRILTLSNTLKQNMNIANIYYYGRHSVKKKKAKQIFKLRITRYKRVMKKTPRLPSKKKRLHLKKKPVYHRWHHKTPTTNRRHITHKKNTRKYKKHLRREKKRHKVKKKKMSLRLKIKKYCRATKFNIIAIRHTNPLTKLGILTTTRCFTSLFRNLKATPRPLYGTPSFCSCCRV